jgi:hypothetical protein
VKRFGDDIYFLVAAAHDDPFLAAILGDSSLTFIERWDEPAYRR